MEEDWNVSFLKLFLIFFLHFYFISRKTRQVGTSSPNFEISSLSKEDEGTYACVARNLAGETEERVQIIVLEEDEFYPYPDQSGGPYPDQNDGRYPDQSVGRYPDPSEGRYPDPSEGRYPDQSGGRYPDQSREPVGSSLVESLPANVGASITYECLTVGSATEFAGQWKRADGRRFPTRHYQTQGVLYLVQVDADDEGDYICEAVDRSGVVIYEITRNLVIKCK